MPHTLMRRLSTSLAMEVGGVAEVWTMMMDVLDLFSSDTSPSGSLESLSTPVSTTNILSAEGIVGRTCEEVGGVRRWEE